MAGMFGALLIRGVNPKAAYQLAMICNENTPDPLPEEEVNRTFQSMLRRDLRNGGEIRGG